MKKPEDKGKGHAVCGCFIKWVLEHIVKESIILEFGSGYGTTKILGDQYELYSIEHNPEWCGLYNSTYIYAPIKNKFYDLDILKEEMPSKYDVIIIDGPPEKIDGHRNGRAGFCDNLDLFNTDAIMIFDDLHRKRDVVILNNVCEKLGQKPKIYSCSCKKKSKKKFAVVNFNG